jgi:Uncharacterized protein conserved in bacteria (DUF2313).
MFYDNAADYKSYLIPKLQDIAEIDSIAGAVNFEIDKLSVVIKKAVMNKCISTCDEDGAARWEKILKVSSPLNSILQARRNALKAKIMAKPAINIRVLKSIIEAYMGLDVDISIDGFTVIVKYRGTSQIADLNPFYLTAYQTIPANMLMDISYLFVTWGEVKDTYLTWGNVALKTWDYIYKGV